jgi:hypothetical protein
VFSHFGIRGDYYGNHVDPWRGWTVMPRHHYGTPMSVHHVAGDGRRLDPAARGAFAAGRPTQGPPRAVPRSNGGGMAMPRYAAASGAGAPKGSLASALPRAGAARELPGTRAPLNPDEAARVFTGSGGRTPGSAAPRPFPEAPGFGGTMRERTNAPAATPDVTAFGSRRRASLPSARGSTTPGGTAQFGNGAPTRFGNGAPTQFGNGAPAQFGNGAPAQFGNGAPGVFGGGARTRAYPRAAPSSGSSGPGEASQPPAMRQNPYSRGGSDAGSVERRPYSGAAEPTAGQMPRGIPFMRGGAGSPAQAAPRNNPYSRGGGSTDTAARPRGGGGGGIPSGSFIRGGGSSGSSAPPSAPRYNPGSGASQPRGGGQPSPPPRRRGGAPD